MEITKTNPCTGTFKGTFKSAQKEDILQECGIERCDTHDR